MYGWTNRSRSDIESPFPLRRIAPGQATGLPASLFRGAAEAPGSGAARRAVAPATRSALEAGGAVPQTYAPMDIQAPAPCARRTRPEPTPSPRAPRPAD